MSNHRPLEPTEGRGEEVTGQPDVTRSPARHSSASAPAKLILCGEHAVVYGRPAIALPLANLRARVRVETAAPGAGITFEARELRWRWSLADEPANPLSELVVRLLGDLAVDTVPDLSIRIASDIPIASGMGSGAAVATALVRALAGYLGHTLPPAAVSALVYASEQRYHGTPSGIDNTVIAHEQPIWFARQSPVSVVSRHLQETTDDRQQTTDHGQRTTIEPLAIGAPLTLLIGDTGVRSATRRPVGEVRRRWQADQSYYETLFDLIGGLVIGARIALERGDTQLLGDLLNQNHRQLQQIGVSSPTLDRLVDAARAAGASGAKLSGAGWGGVMLALVAPQRREQVAAALRTAGAARVLETSVRRTKPLA